MQENIDEQSELLSDQLEGILCGRPYTHGVTHLGFCMIERVPSGFEITLCPRKTDADMSFFVNKKGEVTSRGATPRPSLQSALGGIDHSARKDEIDVVKLINSFEPISAPKIIKNNPRSANRDEALEVADQASK